MHNSKVRYKQNYAIPCPMKWRNQANDTESKSNVKADHRKNDVQK